MILIPKLELRTEQPSGYVPPVGQLFGRRVRAVYNPAADRVFGSGTITHVGGSVVPTEEKLAFRTTTASQGLYSKLSEIYDPTTGSVTLVCLFRNIAPGFTTIGLGSSSGGSGNTLCYIGVTSTNFIQLDFRDSVGNGLVSAGWLQLGVSNSKFHTLVLTLASTGYAVYLDSTLIGSGALSGAPASTVFDYLQISCLVRGGAVLSGAGSAQDVAFAAVLDGAVSDTEARAISSNLWQTFQPQTRRAFVGVSGSNIYTLSPGGSFTFSGSSSVIKTKQYSPSGSITFSGNAIELKTKIQVPSGNITYSGTASITLTNGSTTYTITPSGTITFSGTTDYVKERVVYPTGSITYNGSALELKTRSFVPIGNITFSGNNTEYRTKILAPTGLITFQGSAPITGPGGLTGATMTKLPMTGAGK